MFYESMHIIEMETTAGVIATQFALAVKHIKCVEDRTTVTVY